MLFKILLVLVLIDKSQSISSPVLPYDNYKYSTELEHKNVDLWWTVDNDEREIVFELHVKTLGWIALGISPAGGMANADIAVGWIDQAGRMHFQDRYALGFTRPIIDNTTSDWFPLRGRESNGWTIIQFKRLIDTCDPMDYPIKSGTNILIYAYGHTDPDNAEINYHENRRGTRMIPLRSYGQPPSEDKLAGLDYFDLRLNNYIVPSNDTTYHCKLYKVPNHFTEKRHAIAYKVLIDTGNSDLVHHLLLHECNPSFNFVGDNLPEGVCDEIVKEIEPCLMRIATGWAVGGNRIVEFPDEAGYPVGIDSPNKYFLIQMHYDNPKQMPNRHDSSGIRFYLGNSLRQHDIGYLTFGTVASLFSLAIPPKSENFIVDCYCPSSVTRNIPESGITILSAFPHTHLQGRSVSTKLIRNKKAVGYLFNADSYDFNYQFENRLPKRIQIFPGDEFATRCTYNTMNKDKITFGGERTKDEMCLHFFTYYPRMENLSLCYTMNSVESLQSQMNSSTNFDYQMAQKWLTDRQWTPESIKEWQNYYHNAPRTTIFVGKGDFAIEPLGPLPKYEDLKPTDCQNK